MACQLYLIISAADWKDRWVESKHKSDYGKFEWTSGKFYGDVDKDKGQLEVFLCVHLCAYFSKAVARCTPLLIYMV